MAIVTEAIRRRLLEAARAAEQDRSAELSVAMLADLAGLSEKHFQRLFKQVFEESPKSYVRRLRLQTAAYLLKWSDSAVTEIAMHAGFSTHAGFTKAFTKAYGQSPSDFRASSEVVPFLHHKGEGGEAFTLENFKASRLVVRLERVAAVRIAAMRHIGPTETMAEVWPKFTDWATRRGLLASAKTVFGIHNDYWDRNAVERYRYDAAIAVPNDFEPDDEVVTFIIPGGTVAKTEFQGSLAEADAAWRRLVDQWLPVSGYQFRLNYAYDLYPLSLVTAGPLQKLMTTLTGIEATLCLPVTK